MVTSFISIAKSVWRGAELWVHLHRKTTGSVVAGILVALVGWQLAVGAPASFPADTIFTVASGSSLESISADLATSGYIRHPSVFKVIVKAVLGGERKLVAGDYEFEGPLNTYTIASRIVQGRFDLVPVRITIPEGMNKFEIATLLAKSIAHFDTEHFTNIAPEGYLFPDTYFFPRTATPERIVDTMTKNFWDKIATIDADLQASGRSLQDVVSMASIVELEARKIDTRKIVAGVLWNRLDMGMPLQVDVSFKYINGKTTNEITDEDLRLESPYNSYRYKGLPPTPITNPGLDAIIATIQAKDTDYLFFLSDRNGVMHYATTFDQHKKNKEKYLY